MMQRSDEADTLRSRTQRSKRARPRRKEGRPLKIAKQNKQPDDKQMMKELDFQIVREMEEHEQTEKLYLDPEP